MEKIDLIRSLEKISSRVPDKILKLEGYRLKGHKKEQLIIIIYKGFSSSTTHQIAMDLENKVIEFEHFFTTFILYKAPLTSESDSWIRKTDNPVFFLKQENWI